MKRPRPCGGRSRQRYGAPADSAADTELTDGPVNIPAGTPSSDDTNILDTMATGPGSYSGNQLSTDAEQYSQDEQDYNPDGTVDTAYAQPLMQDIIALERDCPQGAEMGAAVHCDRGLARHQRVPRRPGQRRRAVPGTCSIGYAVVAGFRLRRRPPGG